MRQGFTLIEVLIATALAGIVSVIALNMISQLTTAQARGERRMDLYGRAIVISNQMTRDLMGAFAPLQPAQQKKEEPGVAAEGEKAPAAAAKDTDKKREPKKIEKVFYGSTADGSFDLLTFITNNPARAYWGATAGKPKPLVVRVVYRLEPDKEAPGSFILTRQEGQELDFKAYDPDGQDSIRSFEIARDIKECSLSFVWSHEQEEESPKAGGAPAKETPPAPRVYHRELAWNSDAPQEEGAEKKPMMPQQVDITLTLWEEVRGRRLSFSFFAPIYAAPALAVQKKKEEASQQSVPGKEQPARGKQQTTRSATPEPEPEPFLMAAVIQTPAENSWPPVLEAEVLP